MDFPHSFGLGSVFDAVRLKLIGSVSLGFGVLTDVLTAAALTYYLLQLRTGHHQYVTSLTRSVLKTNGY